MDFIINLILDNIWNIIGVAGFGGLLSLVLKKYVTETAMNKFAFKFFRFGEIAGVFVTVGLAKWKYTKGVWNNIIEPYVVIVVRGMFMNFVNGFISGLESDNQDLK